MSMIKSLDLLRLGKLTEDVKRYGYVIEIGFDKVRNTIRVMTIIDGEIDHAYYGKTLMDTLALTNYMSENSDLSWFVPGYPNCYPFEFADDSCLSKHIRITDDKVMIKANDDEKVIVMLGNQCIGKADTVKEGLYEANNWIKDSTNIQVSDGLNPFRIINLTGLGKAFEADNERNEIFISKKEEYYITRISEWDGKGCYIKKAIGEGTTVMESLYAAGCRYERGESQKSYVQEDEVEDTELDPISKAVEGDIVLKISKTFDGRVVARIYNNDMTSEKCFCTIYSNNIPDVLYEVQRYLINNPIKKDFGRVLKPSN